MIGEHVYHIVPGSMLFMSNLENHAIVSYTKDYERYTLRFSNALGTRCCCPSSSSAPQAFATGISAGKLNSPGTCP